MYSRCLVFFLLAATALSAALNSWPEVSSDGTVQEAASCADILPLVGYSAGRKFCSSRQALSALTSTINPLANRTGTPTQTRRQARLATTGTPRPTNSLPSAPWDSLEEAEPDQIDRICACVAEATVVVCSNNLRAGQKGEWLSPADRPSRFTHDDSDPFQTFHGFNIGHIWSPGRQSNGCKSSEPKSSSQKSIFISVALYGFIGLLHHKQQHCLGRGQSRSSSQVLGERSHHDNHDSKFLQPQSSNFISFCATDIAKV